VEEERSPPALERGGAPVTMMTEENAITRKVPEAEMIATMASTPSQRRRLPSPRILLSGGVVAVAVVGVAIALAVKARRPAPPTPGGATAAPVASPQESPQARPAASAASTAASGPRSRAAADTIRLGITAEPMETALSLDGNVLAGHRLNLEVPKDRGIHVVSASAPGYVPFNQQVSFSSDVVLKISLHRARPPSVRQGARARPSQVGSSPMSNVRPTAESPGPGPRLEPGMNLEGPSMRRNAKPIDERNPYKP
jgi:hypothetical protein